MDYPILSTIKSPDDVKKLNIQKTDALCKEIRECIITTVSKNGGHLASNLGAVELTVALHRAFNSPDDAIIFDDLTASKHIDYSMFEIIAIHAYIIELPWI